MSAAVVEASAVTKVFRQGKLDVEVLKGVDFSVGSGESHAILGASGAGKSTLMHLLGGLDHATTGEIRVVGSSLASLSEANLGRLRNRHLGFIYQFHHLLPEFSALENIAMPLLIRRSSRIEAYTEAQDWLAKIGLQQRADHKPGELSGGEPTGNLDQQTAAQMLELMLDLNRELDVALVVVTHDLGIAARMQHRWHMTDGVLTAESQTSD
jgi:lipoprotein-releasing system ATP-binding protein